MLRLDEENEGTLLHALNIKKFVEQHQRNSKVAVNTLALENDRI